MPAVNKIDSDVVGLRIAEEETIGNLPALPVWLPVEPNTFTDFGGTVNTVARNPLNPSRQRKKGGVVGLDAVAGYDTDVTLTNMQDILQGFVFAKHRKKNELSVATISANTFTVTDGGDGYSAGDILAAKEFFPSSNNGAFTVTGTPTSTDVEVSEALTDAVTQSGIISRVGYTFDDGDADIDASGSLPAIVTTVKDLTTLGLIVGEWLFIGGDAMANQYSNEENNGFVRVRTISANRIEFDKTQSTMVAEDSTGLTISIYFGKVLKNELGPLIVRTTYHLERTLGAPDSDNPNQLQSEYIIGAVPNEFTINIPLEDKVVADLSFIGIDSELRSATEGLKVGSRPPLVESEFLNTSSDVSRISLSQVIEGEPAPKSLFAFAEDISISLTNNAAPNKAVGKLGAFDVSVGTFEVSGSITSYFADIAAVSAVRNNTDITLDAHIVKDNSGISLDLPLISLGDGKPNVEKDQSIKLPLSADAATGAKIDKNLDHTILFVFWDYLPDLAEA